MGGDLKRGAGPDEDGQGLERETSKDERADDPYLLDRQTLSDPDRDDAARGDQTVYLALPRQSFEEWHASGLVRARPNLAQLVTLVREAYEAALDVTGMRTQFDWLADSKRDAGDQQGWSILLDQVDRLKLTASERGADPAIERTLQEFTDARGDGVEQLSAAVELLAEAHDPASEARLNELVKRLRGQLRTLQARSATVGEAYHDASLRAADMVCRALDEVMRVVPRDEREFEPQSFQRELPRDKAPAAAAPAGGDALDRNPSWPRV